MVFKIKTNWLLRRHLVLSRVWSYYGITTVAMTSTDDSRRKVVSPLQNI